MMSIRDSRHTLSGNRSAHEKSTIVCRDISDPLQSKTSFPLKRRMNVRYNVHLHIITHPIHFTSSLIIYIPSIA